MPRHDIVTTIEIGSSKICCLIGEVNADKEVEIIGKGYALSRGVKKGAIVDLDEVTRSVEAAVMDAEKVAGFEIGTVFVGVKNGHMASFNKSFSVNLSHPDKAVAESDVKKLLDIAGNTEIPPNRKILHVIPRGFAIDGQGDIKNPAGMHGSALHIDTHIVTAIDAHLKNTAKVIKMADLELNPQGLVFEPLATALSLLKNEERELGTMAIDIGAGTTDVVIYKHGHILDSFILPVGGNHITYDIGVALKVPLQEAERLKVSFGSAVKDDHCACEEQIEAISFAYKDPVMINQNQLVEIIHYRVAEIFEHIKKQVDKHAGNSIYLAGAVLTGGVAQTLNIDSLAAEKLGLPVRIGYPVELRGLTDVVKNPMYAASVGMLLKGAEIQMSHQNGKTESVKVKGYFQKVFNWLSEIF